MVKSTEGLGMTHRRAYWFSNIERRMTYAEKRRIIFALLMISVYLVLIVSDFAMTISEDQREHST